MALALAVGQSLRTWNAGLPSSPSSSHRGLGSGCQSPSSGLGAGMLAAILVLVELPCISKPTFFLNLLESLKSLGCLSVSGSV